MKRGIGLILAAILCYSFAMGCARKPPVKTAQGRIESFFVKYGKEYPHTIYGKHPVKEVDVISQEEIHKNLVATEAFLSLDNGDLQKVAVTFERRVRWKIVSWEKLL